MYQTLFFAYPHIILRLRHTATTVTCINIIDHIIWKSQDVSGDWNDMNQVQNNQHPSSSSRAVIITDELPVSILVKLITELQDTIEKLNNRLAWLEKKDKARDIYVKDLENSQR